MMIKIPRNVKIGGHTFRIVLDGNLEGYGRRAEVDYKNLIISIVPDKKDTVKNEGLIHEIIHVISKIYLNFRIDDDDIVEPLAEGLWQVLEQFGVEFDFNDLEYLTK